MTDRFIRARTALCIVAGSSIGLLGVAHADMDVARQALSQQKYQQATQELDAVLATKPNDPEARFLKGLTLAREQQTGDAVALFEKLTADYPDMAEGWNNLGVLYARQGKLAKARDALVRAVNLDPRYAPAQENLGDVYVALAENAYTTAGQVDTSSSAARTKGAKLADFLGDGATVAAAVKSPGKSDSPPPVPNVTKDPSSQVTVDTSTPRAALKTWAVAWSAQDVDRYLSMYAAAFTPGDGQSRSAWAASRRAKVSGPSRISVDISDVAVTRRGEQVRLEFEQRYQSSTYQDQMRKALLMTQTADGWQILREDEPSEVDFTRAASAASNQGITATAVKGSQAAATSSAADADKQTAQEFAAVREDVTSALQAWAAAWSDQNVSSYLSAYSDNYEPPGEKPLVDWIRDRQQHLKSPEKIKVTLSDIQVEPKGANTAVAHFEQHYRSPSYQDNEQKSMTFVREDGGWRIRKDS